MCWVADSNSLIDRLALIGKRNCQRPVSVVISTRVFLLELCSAMARRSLMNYVNYAVFIGAHAACLAVFWYGTSAIAVAVCMLLYVLRMFGITAGFHRYFSHRTYKTSRWFQFVMAWLGTSAGQKGPLWWAAHHRHHHRHSDTEQDVHSPRNNGFMWAHVGWILSTRFLGTDEGAVRDLAKFRELRLLNKYHVVPPIALAVTVFFLGHFLGVYYPELGTNGMQMLVWGFFISTILVYHATFCINSLTHMIGYRRFNTSDDSRNSMILALLTLGEGWHNNHHRYPGAESQGYYWWEFDFSHYGLKFLEMLGIVWDIRRAPAALYEEARAER